MEIRLSGHSAYCTEYHLVWIPKYHRRILNPGHLFQNSFFALETADILEKEEISVEVVDLCTLSPLDMDTSQIRLKKTSFNC